MSQAPAPFGAPSPPPGWQPPPPVSPSRSRGWIWVLVASLVVVLGLLGASAGIFFAKMKGPLDAANDYVRAISRHDYDEAFSQLCPENRRDSSPRSLERDLQSDPLFRNLEDWETTPFDVNRDGSRATVEVDLDPDDNDEPDIVTIELRVIDGAWRPCGDLFGFQLDTSD